MTEVNGLVNSVQRVARGSELVTAALSGATTLFVDSAEDFDNAGGDLDVNGIRYVYTASDIDADTVTLAAPGLTAAAEVSDAVAPVMGGQIAIDHIAYVTMGEGDEAEVIIPFSDRVAWPEGFYADPVPVVLSADLTSIVEVPGRVPIIDGTVFQTATNGERIVIRNDGDGGVLESFTGLANETAPSVIDPSAQTIGVDPRPIIVIRSGLTTTQNQVAKVTVASGSPSNNGGIVLLEGDSIGVVGLNAIQVSCPYGTVSILGAIDLDGSLVANGSVHGLDIYADGQTGVGTVGASLTNQGRLIRTPSTRRVKKNIKRMTLKAARAVLGMEPVTFQLRSEKNGPTYPGFIAEQADEAGAELWVARDNDGAPAGIRYAEMTAAHNVILRDYEKRIDRLEKQVADLTARPTRKETR